MIYKSYIAPRQRGCIILFDSRTAHRVLKVKKNRRSIVGWVVGSEMEMNEAEVHNKSMIIMELWTRNNFLIEWISSYKKFM